MMLRNIIIYLKIFIRYIFCIYTSYNILFSLYHESSISHQEFPNHCNRHEIRSSHNFHFANYYSSSSSSNMYSVGISEISSSFTGTSTIPVDNAYPAIANVATNAARI